MSNKSILQSHNDALNANNLDLQSLIEQVNALPNAGGIELPELINEGSASDLLSGKELINDEGNVVIGTFSIDSELTTQDDLITQIQAAVDNLPEAGEGQPDLINFTIQYGSSNSPTILNCQAESGMSLGSWIFSSYNNITSKPYGNIYDGYWITNNKTILFTFAGGEPTMTINDTKVDAFDTIQPNGVYTALFTFNDYPH